MITNLNVGKWMLPWQFSNMQLYGNYMQPATATICNLQQENIPGTQMTLVLIGSSALFWGVFSLQKIEVNLGSRYTGKLIKSNLWGPKSFFLKHGTLYICFSPKIGSSSLDRFGVQKKRRPYFFKQEKHTASKQHATPVVDIPLYRLVDTW